MPTKIGVDGKRRKTGGRKKGSGNKVTADLRDSILSAYNKLGGEAWLVTTAKIRPDLFISLLGRCLPREINANVNVVDQFVEKLRAAQARAAMYETKGLTFEGERASKPDRPH